MYINQPVWTYTFASNTPGGFYFSNSYSSSNYYYSMDGLGSSVASSAYFNLDAQFATKDTVWIVADTNAALPRKPTLTTTNPVSRKMVVLFRSPWTNTINFQSGNLGFVPGTRPFASNYYWSSATLADFGSLTLGIRDQNMSYNFGPTGPVYSSTTTLALDSMATRNDTIWVVAGASGAPVVRASEPPSLVVLFKNPWATTNPGVQPGVSVDGLSTWTPMSSASGLTGWSVATLPYTATMVSFRDSSSSGFNYLYSYGFSTSRYQFRIDTSMAKNDTVWVVPSASGTHSFSSAPPTTRSFTLMLRNPWDSTNPGLPPYGRVEGLQWNAFTSAPRGWYSMAASMDGTRLQVAIRNSTGTSYLGSYGLTTSSTAYLTLDTAMARNDTIWLIPQSTLGVIAGSSEPVPRQGVVMLLNPWEATYPGQAPWLQVESQGQTPMAAVSGKPGWYSSPFQVFGSALLQFYDSYKSYTKTRLVLDTALAKNDTVWVVYPGTGASTPQVFTSEPVARTATILFKSPWDSTAPFYPGSMQVEGGAWTPLTPVSSMPGWYQGTASFIASLTVGIRDSKGTSYVAFSGTSTYTGSSIVLDTAFRRNDTVWIVGGAGNSTTTGVFTSSPVTRPLTIVLQNPWETTSPNAAPSLLVNGMNWQAFSPYLGQAGWYATSVDFYGSLQVQISNAARTSYLYYGGTTASSISMVLDTAYAKNDTIWLLPIGGTVRAYSVDPDPQPLVVMLDNPWKGAYYAGVIPQMQLGGAGWTQMVPVPGDSGWFSAKGVYVSDLRLGIRLASGYSYLGPRGTTSQVTDFALDSLVRRNDTVWISSGTGGKPPRIRTVDPKHAKVAMIFNPWDGVFPLQRPVAFFGGASKGASLAPSIDHCGWYELELTAFPSDLLLRSSRTGDAFGAGGVGSTTGIDLTGQLVDTVWISPAASGVRISHLASSQRGVCATALIAATVRDFRLAAIAPPSSGSMTNLVTDQIGPDRKPVIRRGSSGLPMQQVWFRDSSAVNATTCRDLVMTLDTATGVYRMSYPSFYPVDDFTTLPDGSINPYNDKSSISYGNNYGFCLESHGQFRHSKGRVDSIAGQDDIFQYINGKRVTNLGGTHSTLSSIVGMDTLGLVDGNVYPWDLFFCDRMSSYSVLGWAMPGLLANPLARVDSAASGSVWTLRANSVTTVGQGCDRTETILPVRGWVGIKGLYDSVWTTLAAGVHHGGIQVLDSAGVQVDTAAITGLPYGIYQVRLRASNDTLVFRDIIFQVEAPSNLHPYSPAARCDLRSGTIRSGVGCIDLGDLDGDTLRISRNTTRMSTEGLVLCGGTATVVAGTDIAYLQDNSGSMSSSDPTDQRGNIVRDAIELHSQIAPSSYAAYLPFESNFTSTQLYNITDPVERDDIKASITLGSGGGTNYSGVLGWARVLLEGAKSFNGQTMAASPNTNKAIIVISDGQPGDETASNNVLLPGATTTYQGITWTLPADTSVPVFGFMITQSSSAMTTGRILYDITQKTGGQFIVIPPNDPDSLRSAMMTVLGSIVAKAKPDTLRITNLTNGQVSRGLSSGREGNGWRFRLDSLVGLEPGANQIQMRGVFTTVHGDSVVNAKWTVMVTDSADEFVVGGRDTTLMLSCSAPTQLKVRPATDTTRHFADARDASLSFWLDTRYDKLLQSTVQFWTDASNDSGRRTLGTATTPDAIRAYSNGTVSWTGAVVNRTDIVVQTDMGWDTLRAVYRTPRDWRDTAVGFLPVFRNWPVSVRFSPDTVKGAKGDLVVIVRDANVVEDTVQVKVFQNRRDSVWVVLRRDSTSQFVGRVPFVQGAAVVLDDSLLQAGPIRLMPLDSVFALYQSKRDTAILRRPEPRLRFVDGSGRPVDSLPARTLSIGGKDTVRVGVFVDTIPITNTIEDIDVVVPSWLSLRTLAGSLSSGRFRLSSGKTSFVLVATGPGTNGDARVVRSAGPDTLHRRVDVGGLRLRFVDGSGRLLDTASVDRDVFSDTLIRVEVWDGNGLCQACDGWMTNSVSDAALRFADSNGVRRDSVRIFEGRAAFRLGSDRPVSGAVVDLASTALGAKGVVSPVEFRPFRLRYVDGSGNMTDSAWVDRDMLSDTLVRVEVWGRSGLCSTCSGNLGVSTTDAVRIGDSSGRATDSVRIVGGRAVFRLGSDRPVSGAKVTLGSVLPGVGGVVSPIDFRPFRLRYVDGSGNVADSAWVDRDMLSDTLVRVEVWGRSGLCSTCSGNLGVSTTDAVRIGDSSGRATDSVRIVGGRAVFRLGSDRPVSGAKVTLGSSLLVASGVVSPIDFRPFRLRYVDGSGNVTDSAWVDRDMLSDTLVRVEVWGRSGLCSTCSGNLGVSTTDAVRIGDSSGRATDSVRIVGGRAVFRLGSDRPVSGAKVTLGSSLLVASGVVSPIDFRPFRLRYVDGSGTVVDSARVDRDMLSDTLLHVEVWGRSGLCSTCSGMLGVAPSTGIRITDSSGRVTDSIRLSGGRGMVGIGSLRPVSGGEVTLSSALLGSSAKVSPVDFHALRVRYVRPDGSVSDSFACDTLARRVVRVRMEVWGSSGRVDWNGRMRIDSAGSTVVVSDTSGRSGTEFTVTDGIGVFQLRSDAPAVSRPRLAIDSLALATGFGPVSWRVPAPDSVVYLDVDGDGGLDRVKVRFVLPWNPDNALVFRWPDSASVLDLAKASRKVSDDSLSVEWSFDKSPAPRVTAWRAASVPATFAWNASSKANPVPTLERIAPIAIRARIARGTDKDTLLVWASEPLDASGVSGGDDLVRRTHPSSLGVVSASPRWDSARRVLCLPLDRSKIDSLVRPTDSVRFAPGGEIRDGRGSAVGDASPSVEVEGLDLGPISAVVLDADADGRADRVVLRFERAPRVVEGYRFSWPGRDGKLQKRDARARDARTDSSGRVVEFGLAPWEFGATQCDSVGCRDLGSMWTARWGDTLEARFDLADGVLPVILKAQLRLRRTASDPDTLRAELSEKVKIGERGDWLRFGKPSRDSAGQEVERLRQRSREDRILELLLDSTFTGGPGDSVRLSAWPKGGVEDGAGNRPGRFLHWTPLEVGPARAKLVAMVWPDVARYKGWKVPPSEPPLSVFVRPSSKAPWKTPLGNSPRQETSHYTGILLRTNKSLEGASLYLYDNMGVAMAFVDLADVQKALKESRVESSLRGDVDLWIAWNGLTRQGVMAPSGVYLARVVGWVVVDGRREVVNQVYNLGWHNPYTPVPPPDLDFLPQYDWSGW